MADLILPAPAKLNLFLHIIGQRADGYHRLQTAFQFLDYSDELTFNLRTDAVINLIDITQQIPQENNLILRTAQALQTLTKTTYGADIILKKKIPIGGGLGGGSSDAATTLLGLNYLWQTKLTLTQLADISLTLGADIPVFIHGHAAWAEGIGEILTPIELSETWFVVLIPPCQVVTAEIYADPQLTRNTQPITISDFFMQGGHNDFTRLVCEKYPPVAAALNWLNQYGKARLTGSGACIFAAFADKKRAQTIAKKIPSPFSGFVAKGVNLSPLQTTFAKMLQHSK